MMGGFCTECGYRVEAFDGLNTCPACGTSGLPCADDNQVDVSINWHELRILCIWAENWQRSHAPEARTIFAIAKRLHAQHPYRTPLTLAMELGQVAERFSDVSVSDPLLRRDIAEQTGHETGLTGA